MKTLLSLSLLFLALAAVQAQDFRAVVPSQQPNAVELAYFGGRNPTYQIADAPDSASVRLVLDFLNNLKDSRLGGLRIRVPFHTLARLFGGLIEQTNTSYGTNQLFYDLGFRSIPSSLF